jgi:hypothetical protein
MRHLKKMTSYSYNPHAVSTTTSTRVTSSYAYDSSLPGKEESIDSEVNVPPGTRDRGIGSFFTIACPLCEAPIDVKLEKMRQEFREDPLPSMLLIYKDKPCDCPDVSLHRREKSVG